jgi:hypothetical protein
MIKGKLFNNEWGEIYLNANPYLDTYFSLITETVFDYIAAKFPFVYVLRRN